MFLGHETGSQRIIRKKCRMLWANEISNSGKCIKTQAFATRSSIPSNARTLVKKFFPRSAICNIQLYIQQYAAIDSNIQLFSWSRGTKNVPPTKSILKIPNFSREYFQDIYYVISLIIYQKIEGERGSQLDSMTLKVVTRIFYILMRFSIVIGFWYLQLNSFIC